MPEENLSDIERALTDLKPAGGGISRDALLFRAGQASVMRPRVWPFIALTLSMTALGLGAASWMREQPTRVVYVEVPRADPAPTDDERPHGPEGVSPQDGPHDQPHPGRSMLTYLRMQQHALRFGVESLPMTVNTEEEPVEPMNPSDLSAGDRPRLMPPFSSFFSGVD